MKWIGHKKKHRRSLALAVFWEIGDKSPIEIIETKQTHAVVRATHQIVSWLSLRQ